MLALFEQSQVRWFQSFPNTLFLLIHPRAKKQKVRFWKQATRGSLYLVFSTSILLKEILSQFCVHMRSYLKFSTPWPVFINLIPVFIFSSQMSKWFLFFLGFHPIPNFTSISGGWSAWPVTPFGQNKPIQSGVKFALRFLSFSADYEKFNAWLAREQWTMPVPWTTGQ